MNRRIAVLALAVLLLAATSAPSQETAEPQSPLGRAIAHFEAGEDAEALRALEELRDDPNAPPQGLAFLGALYVENGRPFEALEVLRGMAELADADAAVLYNAGRAAVMMGEPVLAERYLQRSVELAPDSPAGRELGLLQGARGRFGSAYVLLRPWVRAHPDDLEARLAATLCAVQLERVPDAEELLSDLPQELPKVRLLWGRVLLLKGDPWGSLAILKPVLEDPPPEMELDVRGTVAEAYSAMGEAASAVEVLEGVGDRGPFLNLQLGQARYQSGDLEGAIATLATYAEPLLEDQSTVPDPPLAGKIVLDYGRFLAMSGQHERALPFLEMATRVLPGNKQGWQMLGQTLAGLGRREEAQAALEHFVEIGKQEQSSSEQDVRFREERNDPTLKAIRETRELIDQGRFQEALERIRQERAVSPEDLRPLLLEGRILLFVDQPQQALISAELALAGAPDNVDARYLRGAARMGTGDLVRAEADFRQVLVIDPRHVPSLSDLAVLLMGNGETAEARSLLEQVLEIQPNNSVAVAQLEQLGGE